MRAARVLGKSAALVSSLTLLAGFVAFRAGAFDRPLPTRNPSEMELSSLNYGSLDVLREPRGQSHNWLGQTLELSDPLLIDVPIADEELEPVFALSSPVTPESEKRKTVLPGSKGMEGIFVRPQPFYNSTTPIATTAQIITENSNGTIVSTHTVEVISGSKSLSAAPMQDWTQVRAIFGNATPPERLRPVINGSKSGMIDFTPGIPDESILNILPSAQWLFDDFYLTPEEPQGTNRSTVFSGSKSTVIEITPAQIQSIPQQFKQSKVMSGSKGIILTTPESGK